MPGMFDGTPLQRPVTCEACERPLNECRCQRNARGEVLQPSMQTAALRTEKRGKGKVVTVVAGLDPVASDLDALLRELKSNCGAGGNVDSGTIVLQGDQRNKAAAHLRAAGYTVKGA